MSNSEPLFQKLINKFEGVRLEAGDTEAIKEVLDVIREIQSEYVEFQKMGFLYSAKDFVKRIF